MAEHNCEHCKLRAAYDKSPGSIMGRLWRWHINWCPGWRGYVGSLDDERKSELKDKYDLKQ